jgi:hypothetical protein
MCSLITKTTNKHIEILAGQTCNSQQPRMKGLMFDYLITMTDLLSS